MKEWLLALAVSLFLPLRSSAATPHAAASSPDSVTHVAGSGFRLVSNASGTLNFRLYATVRYLNENGLDDHYTDSFGQTKPVNTLHDIQVNKVIFYFYGWLLNPKLRYLTYAWTTNSSQGLSAQVVVAGNVEYAFSDRATLGFGINSLPGTRSTAGTFPMWLAVDNRVIADEFFRPSYSTGLWMKGTLARQFRYQLMVANNLSQLGVDAGQLDNDLSTFSGDLWWTGANDFGKGFGDFDRHERMATRIGVHYTNSDEDRQSQPGTEAPDNTQIRLSDGNIVFIPGLFGPGISVEKIAYHMAAVDGGVKWHGLALGGEAYFRRLDNLRGPGVGTLSFDHMNDQGLSWYASGMAIPSTLELYLRGSKVFGERGDPWDARVGGSWFLWKNQTIRWHNEVIVLSHSPVGALSLPYVVGGNGVVFNSNFEINF